MIDPFVIGHLMQLGETLKNEHSSNVSSQNEAAEKRRTLEIKRLFVRYVGHEIRTPLSTASVGLKLIQSIRTSRIEDFFGRAHMKLCEGGELPEVDRRCLAEEIVEAKDVLTNVFDMVDEVTDSCDIAIGILNGKPSSWFH